MPRSFVTQSTCGARVQRTTAHETSRLTRAPNGQLVAVDVRVYDLVYHRGEDILVTVSLCARVAVYTYHETVAG